MKVKAFIMHVGTENCYLVWDDDTNEAILIDPGEIDTRIDKIVADEKLKVKYVVLTHMHFDHIGGVKFYADKYGASVAIHKLDADGLSDRKISMAEEFRPDIPTFEADIMLEDGDKINFGNTVAEVIHTPGHTVGGICLHIEKSLFSGDTLFYKSVGRCDFPRGDFNALKKSITEKLFRLDDSTIVFPGHGSKTTIGFEKENNPYTA